MAEKTPEELRAIDARIHVEVMGEREPRWLQSEPCVTEVDAKSPLGITCNFGGAEFGADRDWHVDCWWDDDANMPIPRYTRDIADDYSVLVKVRETWNYSQREQFWYALHRLWEDRRVAHNPHEHSSHPNVSMYYQPGDYSLAALSALGAKP